MTTANIKPTSNPSASLWTNPWFVGIGIIIYVVVVTLILLSLDRRNTWFPLLSTLAFPPLALAPMLIFNAPLPQLVKAIGLILLLGVALPLVGIYDTNYLELMIQISIFSALALGLNIVVGFAGLLDLGYVAFFAVGAYIWAMFTSNADTYFKLNNMLVPGSGYITVPGLVLAPGVNVQIPAFPLFMVLAVVAAALFGILLGLPVLRLRGDYLAIVTLGFGEVIRVLVNNLDKPANITNGAQGLHDVAAPSSAFLMSPLRSIIETVGFRSTVAIESTSQQILLYFIAIAIVGIIIVLANRLDNSPIGRAWTAIREDEVAAIAMGVPLVRMKLLAFATGAACAGAVGVLYGAKQTFVSPESFQLTQSINILAMVIVGGLGGIRGVLLGATVVTLLNLQVLSNFSLQINSLRTAGFVVSGIVIRFIVAIPSLLIAWWGWTLANSAERLKKLAEIPYELGKVRILRRREIPLNTWVLIVRALVIIFSIVFLLIPVLLPIKDFAIKDWPTQLTPDKYQRFVFGILLVVMMIFRPEGLLPEPRRAMEMHKDEDIPDIKEVEDAA
jgi:branched-chain amino acid transport system permease protein